MPTRPERRLESFVGLEQDMNGIRLDSFLHIAYLCVICNDSDIGKSLLKGTMKFKINSAYKPAGDQPSAIEGI